MSKDLTGKKMPKFKAQATSEKEISSTDYENKNLVIYFYPKDMTPGCTPEASNFRDAYPAFSMIDAKIIGVSKDSVERHNKFKDKYELPFILASDQEGEVCNAYCVWQEKINYGKTYMGIVRSTFLINERGKITAVWRNLRVKGHVQKVLEEAKKLQRK